MKVLEIKNLTIVLLIDEMKNLNTYSTKYLLNIKKILE
jgi:hypothetical protein